MITSRPLASMASAVLSVIADPRVWRPSFALIRMVRPLLRWFVGWSSIGFPMGMVYSTSSESVSRRLGVGTAAPAPGRQPLPSTSGPACVFRGCIMDGLFGHVHRATERVLQINGFRTIEAPGQTCCGALHAHAGRMEEARQLARHNLAVFAGNPKAWIVVNSAGCGAMLKSYGHLMSDSDDEQAAAVFSRRVVDISEILLETGPKQGQPLPLRVAYDPPCHLYHAQRVTDAPLRMLDAIPGITRIELSNATDCCGSAGLYSLTQREMSIQILKRKLAAIRDANPDLVVSGNPGCLMHIGAGLMADGQPTRVAHPVELLDWSYRGLGRTSPHAAS